MPLILDTFNVLHTVGVLPPDLAGIDIQDLVGLIKTSRYRDEKVILACDGKPKPDLVSGEPTVTIRFSGAGKPADDLIDQLVRASSAPRRLIVVSSDHAVQRTGRRRRCTVLTSEEFLGQLADDANLGKPSASSKPQPKPQTGMTGDQVDRWIKVFNLDDRLVSLPARAPVETPQPESIEPIMPAELAEESETEGDLVSDESGDIKPVLPPSLIEQAERIWKEQNPETPAASSSTQNKPDETK